MGTERLFRLSLISFCFLFYLSCCLRFFDFMTCTLLWIPAVHTNTNTYTCTLLRYYSTLKNDSSAYINICLLAASRSTTVIFLAIARVARARRHRLSKQERTICAGR